MTDSLELTSQSFIKILMMFDIEKKSQDVINKEDK